MPGSRVTKPTARHGELRRRGRQGEALAPPVTAVMVAVALYAFLPESLLLGPRLLVPAVEVVLLAALVPREPKPLLFAALQVWATNVIGFALIYWELDRGGPVSRARRARADLPQADWRFSQDENDDAVIEVSAGSSARSG